MCLVILDVIVVTVYKKKNFRGVAFLFPQKGFNVLLTIMCTREGNWSRQWDPTPVLLPGKSHGWRSLVGCNPWGY